MRKLFIASTNRGKIEEIESLLDGLDFESSSLRDIKDFPEIEETGKTFAENALIKARAAYKLSNVLTLADDSGLEVDYLSGEPGIYSARYSGGSDDDNCNKLLNELKDVPEEKRTARFRCAVCLYNGENEINIFEGKCEGKIIFEKRGTGGFGYDPLFVPNGFDQTFGELEPEIKNKISHRGRAMLKMKEYLTKSLH